MNITRSSIEHGPAVLVGVAIIALFGVLALRSLPIQLLPILSQPQITVFNNWREAAPQEMEANIVEPQEQLLRRTPGVLDITSNIGRGFGSITLTFSVETDMQQALISVINNLNQAPPLPVDANEPFIAAGAGFDAPNAATLLIRPLPDNPNQDLYDEQYQKVIDTVVEPRLSRIPGIAQVNLQGQRPREVHIEFDPYRAAALGVSIGDITNAVSRANDVSGGFADVGRRQYTVRIVGQYEVAQLGEMIIGWSGDRPIHLNEVAEVTIQLTQRRGLTMRNGYPAYYITIQRDHGSNTVDIVDSINAAIAELNDGALAEAGLTMDLSFDASVYIRRALALVKNSLGLGVLLAIGVLWFFLRDRRATAIIATAIPVSLLVAFVALQVFGLSLNVISLAGLAFSVGLVLDAAIIVQENIVRYRQAGMRTLEAVIEGARQVRGALFASTVTTIAIFLPVMFMKGQEGQMFGDLALTLSIAVLASFVVALTVLPLASAYLLAGNGQADPREHWWAWVTRTVMRLTDGARWRTVWIVGLIGGSIAVATLLMPKADFLPSASADATQSFFNVPPGVTLDVFEKEIAGVIVERLRPHMEHKEKPYIKGYNLSMFGNFNILYLYPQEPDEVEQFLALLRGPLLSGIPDTQTFVSRASLLGIGFNGGRTINVNLQGPDIARLMDAARIGLPKINELIPGATVRPVPSLSLAEPELQLEPDDRRITQAGLDQRTVATAVRAMTGGLFIGEYFDGNDRLDMLLKAGQWRTPEELAAMPLSTPLAGIQTIGELTKIRRAVGPTQLQRIDGQRTISLQVLPPETMTVEEALDILREQAGPVLQDALPAGYSVHYRGSADRLEAALADMLKNFVLAIIILFLVMAAIFRSPRDSLLVLMVMPLALAGGVGALALLNLVTYQSLDLLTMIGFIILLGLVVNNAILLVSQTRDGETEGLSRRDAVEQAVRVRARPVYMSTLTSIFGMLPLALLPGVGSDIYRGLAIVIVGGMIISMFFTLILMPSLLRVGEQGGVLARIGLNRAPRSPLMPDPSSASPPNSE